MSDVNHHESVFHESRNDDELLDDLVNLARGSGSVGMRAWYTNKTAILAAVRGRMGNGLRAFQVSCHTWVLKCLGPSEAHDVPVRLHRFLEEALELVQSLGATRHEAHKLVDYVFGRPEGEPRQELGGVMTTLAALCAATHLDMQDDGLAELARVSVPSVMEKIRRKHFAKPRFSPLPESADRSLSYADTDALVAELSLRGVVVSCDLKDAA